MEVEGAADRRGNRSRIFLKGRSGIAAPSGRAQREITGQQPTIGAITMRLQAIRPITPIWHLSRRHSRRENLPEIRAPAEGGALCAKLDSLEPPAGTPEAGGTAPCLGHLCALVRPLRPRNWVEAGSWCAPFEIRTLDTGFDALDPRNKVNRRSTSGAGDLVRCSTKFRDPVLHYLAEHEV